jgi:heat shock protein HtpX
MYNRIAQNVRRTWLLMLVFSLLLMALAYAIGEATRWGWEVVFIGFALAVAVNLYGYYHSDRLTLALSGARPVTKAEEPDFYNLVENTAIAAGLPTPAVYVIEDSAPNAFATGRDPQHSAIVATRGLLDKLQKVELEGVVAHEMSHVKNYDIRLMTIAVILAGMVVLVSDLFLRWTFWGGAGRRRERGGGQAQVILLVMALVLAILAPLAATLLRLAISRRREFLADADGALLTRYPEGLARALEKLDADEEPLEAANKATAHLYIVSPLKGHPAHGRLALLFDTHPPIEERVAALRSMMEPETRG